MKNRYEHRVREGRGPSALLKSGPRKCGAGAAAAVVLFLGACEPAAKSPDPVAPFRPDIFLIVIDCLRADHVGAYGYPLPTSPSLDAIAREGVRFDAAYTNATWTKPSMATLFSGRYPSEHGLLKLGVVPSDEIETDAVPEDLPMIAEALRAAGYRTLASVNQVHLSAELGFGRGFEDYRWARSGRMAGEVNRQLEIGLDAIPAGEPVFGWVHYIDAHWPYRSGRREPMPELGDPTVNPPPPKEQSRDVIAAWTEDHLDEANRRGLMARYDREIREVDRAVGELVTRLKARGRYDEALIVVTADHGEGFFEHGKLMHGFEPYEEVARVPLLIKPPRSLRIPPGGRATPVSHVDWSSTLLDLLGLPALPGASGASYLGALKGVESSDRNVLLQSELSVALRDGEGRKVILKQDGSTELYDLVSDPLEKRNLARDGCDERCAALRDDLRSRLAKLKQSPALRRLPLAPADVEELRALGYL